MDKSGQCATARPEPARKEFFKPDSFRDNYRLVRRDAFASGFKSSKRS